MKRFGIAILVMLILTGTATANPVEEIVKGFRGIEWGANLSDSEKYPTFELLHEFTEGARTKKIYTRQDEPPRMGIVDISTIWYFTEDDKFHRALLEPKNPYVLLSVLREAFGQPDVNNPLTQEFAWFLGNWGNNVIVDYDGSGDAGSIIALFSKIFSNRSESDIENARQRQREYRNSEIGRRLEKELEKYEGGKISDSIIPQ